MRFFSLAFLCGIVLLQFFSQLPDIKWLVLIVLLSFFILFYSKILTGFLLGFAWAFFYAYLQLSWSLPQELEGKTVNISGKIASIPEKNSQGLRFLFQLEKLNDTPAKGYVRLSLNEEIKLYAGEKWQLPVRLKRVHGLQNPGGFDYEAWSLQQGIRAQGYVDKKGIKIKLGENKFSIDRFRQYLYEKMKENFNDKKCS